MTHSSSPNALPPITAIVVAAGRGQRFGDSKNKIFSEILGEPLWFLAARQLTRAATLHRLVIVISESDRAIWDSEQTRLSSLGAELVVGGRERTESVRAGFEAAAASAMADELIAVHDAARPCVTLEDLQRVFAVAATTGAALLARPLTGSIKRSVARPPANSRSHDLPTVGSAPIESSIDRRHLWEALTPQVFRCDVFRKAFDRWRGRPLTDDAQLVELSGYPVTLVPGAATNLKVTSRDDLDLATAILQKR